jgi:CRISPR-associated protein Cmr4
MNVRHARFFFLTQEPVHIGAGGYRLGRVDMTICREPGTNLPKIPGTSLAGAARSYAAQRYGKPEASGQHLDLKHKAGCPIIYTFGTASKNEAGVAGTVSVGDARLLFFPVQSMAGPVWVTTTELLEGAGFTGVRATVDDAGIISSTLADWKEPLNLSWLRLDTPKPLTLTPPDALKDEKCYQAISARLVAISPKLFSQIVNNNLEVRTSVSINPETGAAEEHMLFTYEAIPRGTWLVSEAVEDNYRPLAFPAVDKCFRNSDHKENSGESLGESWSQPLDVLKAGLRMIEYLGVGGMGTRGFGRMKLLAEAVTVVVGGAA